MRLLADLEDRERRHHLEYLTKMRLILHEDELLIELECNEALVYMPMFILSHSRLSFDEIVSENFDPFDRRPVAVVHIGEGFLICNGQVVLAFPKKIDLEYSHMAFLRTLTLVGGEPYSISSRIYSQIFKGKSKEGNDSNAPLPIEEVMNIERIIPEEIFSELFTEHRLDLNWSDFRTIDPYRVQPTEEVKKILVDFDISIFAIRTCILRDQFVKNIRTPKVKLCEYWVFWKPSDFEKIETQVAELLDRISFVGCSKFLFTRCVIEEIKDLQYLEKFSRRKAIDEIIKYMSEVKGLRFVVTDYTGIQRLSSDQTDMRERHGF